MTYKKAKIPFLNATHQFLKAIDNQLDTPVHLFIFFQIHGTSVQGVSTSNTACNQINNFVMCYNPV